MGIKVLASPCDVCVRIVSFYMWVFKVSDKRRCCAMCNSLLRRCLYARKSTISVLYLRADSFVCAYVYLMCVIHRIWLGNKEIVGPIVFVCHCASLSEFSCFIRVCAASHLQQCILNHLSLSPVSLRYTIQTLPCSISTLGELRSGVDIFYFVRYVSAT